MEKFTIEYFGQLRLLELPEDSFLLTYKGEERVATVEMVECGCGSSCCGYQTLFKWGDEEIWL